MSGPCASYPLTPRWTNLHLSDQQNSCCLAIFAPLRLLAFVHCLSERNGPARNLFPLDPLRQNCWSHIIVSRLISELCSIDQQHPPKHTKCPSRHRWSCLPSCVTTVIGRARSSPFPDRRVDGAKNAAAQECDHEHQENAHPLGSPERRSKHPCIGAKLLVKWIGDS
jgi:hypothetical protein